MAAGLYSYPEFHKQVWRPRTVAEAWQLKQRLAGQAVFVSGGTLLRTQWELETAAMPPNLISLEFIPELGRIHKDKQEVRIGSAVKLSACLRNSEIPPLLKAACSSIAAPSIRNIAAIGGNIMSATGDSLPALLASGARLVWFDGHNMTPQSAAEWLRQRRSDSAGKEQRLLIEVIIPVAEKADYFYEKLGRREAFCPSVVTVAGQLETAADRTVVSVRLAASSAAAAAVRLTDAEELLQGQRVSAELIKHIHPLIAGQFDGGSDPFASNLYRQQAAANMIAAALWSRIPRINR